MRKIQGRASLNTKPSVRKLPRASRYLHILLSELFERDSRNRTHLSLYARSRRSSDVNLNGTRVCVGGLDKDEIGDSITVVIGHQPHSIRLGRKCCSSLQNPRLIV